jgi:hypothetical protein
VPPIWPRNISPDITLPYIGYHDNKADFEFLEDYSSPVSSNSPRIGFNPLPQGSGFFFAGLIQMLGAGGNAR